MINERQELTVTAEEVLETNFGWYKWNKQNTTKVELSEQGHFWLKTWRTHVTRGKKSVAKSVANKFE